MERRWLELLDTNDYLAAEGGRPPFWRYFEMDCVLTGLRAADPQLDSMVMSLAGYPVGNAGQVGTPHEFLVADKVSLPWPALTPASSSNTGGSPSLNTAANKVFRDGAPLPDPSFSWQGPWMLKLKSGDPVNADEYREFVDAAKHHHHHQQSLALERKQPTKRADKPQPKADSREQQDEETRPTTVVQFSRIIWLFWDKGESDSSVGERDRLCIEGWRSLNSRPAADGPTHEIDQGVISGWEVRVLSDATAAVWAAPVVALWAEGLPDGAGLQHRADLLRTYLLATYGGVWADTSVLPLAPLDAWIPQFEARAPTSQVEELFFAYTFPDPTLSWQVSLIPHTYAGDPEAIHEGVKKTVEKSCGDRGTKELSAAARENLEKICGNDDR
jgi:hypothetical protein